jgi:Tol biopolymer transport system component
MFRRSTLALLAALVAAPIALVAPQRAQATVPGSNGKIAFTSTLDGRTEVYTANADGSGVTELTDSAGADSPSWSPDGSSLAYAGGPDPAGIYTVSAAGGTPHRVTDGSFMTAWSGDGSRLAFVGGNNGSGPDIFTVNVDGTAKTDVAPGSISPAWSPDGSKIAYRGFNGIYVMNADGTNKTRLTTVTGDDNPSFSPDGTKIAFDSVGSGSQRQVFVMDADGSSQVQLTSSSTTKASGPSWSPDGTSLVVRTFDGTTYALAVMRSDGTELHSVISNMGTVDEPDWQAVRQPKPPFNGKVVFNTIGSGSSTNSTISTISPDDTQLTNVSGPDGGFEPAWSPDGTKLAFLGNNPSGLGIYVMDADGANRHLVVASTTQPIVVGLAWSPDGSKIAYSARSVAETTVDVWTVNIDGTGNGDIATVGEFPAWSPDGSKLLFNRAWTIVEANADGSNPTTVFTPSPGMVAQAPSFSPDGTKIVFGLGSSSTASELWVMNADGTGQKQLTNLPGYNTYPRYSPDGRFLAFEQSSAGQDGPFHLALMNADGSGTRTLAGDGGDDEFLDWQPLTQPALPGAPTQVSATGGDSWAKVSWQPPLYDGGVPVASCTVTASPGGASVTVPASQTWATVLGLANGTAYTLTVSAVNRAGAGPASAPSNAVTPIARFNGKIAFTRTVAGVSQVFTANSDGTGATQITNDPGGSAMPSWSPDGTQLAIDGGPNPTGVYVINADGTNPKRVSANPALFISWSPDGTRLAYIRPGTVANTTDIATVNVDGTGEKRLGSGIAPVWTPDSKRIVFRNDAVLWTMNADDGSDRTPFVTSGYPHTASVSPDGTRVVFSSLSGITVAGIDGSNPTVINPNNTTDLPRWSPDGKQIIYQTAAAGATSGSTLAVMNADGSGAHAITSGQGNDQFSDWQPLTQDPNGTFVPLPPLRILDTRTTNSPIGPNKSIDVIAAGKGGVPATGVSAVVVNLTATQPTAGSYLTAYPTGSAPPLTSNLNFGPGQTIPNLVVVKLGTGGKFSVYNAQGFTHLIADVVGWYSDGSVVPGDRYTPVAPARILDTRTTNSPVGPNKSIDVQATGEGLVPATGVSAVVVNLTATQPTAGSYLTAYPTGSAPPLTSNLNFGPGQTIPNLVVVKLGTGGKFSVYNAQGNTHVIADVVGWYSDDASAPGASYTPLAPARILDTRTTNSPIGPNKSIDVQATGHGLVPASGVSAVVVNLTATEPTTTSYLTAFPTGTSPPLASNLNFVPGQTIPNLVVVKLGTGGKFSIYNAQGNTQVIADVVGWYSG